MTAKTAKLFKSGRSQAVRLPKEFRFEGKDVRIRRYGLGVLLEPIHADVKEWFAALDRFREPFPKREEQPAEQERKPLD
jgi:antitoxin VapB